MQRGAQAGHVAAHSRCGSLARTGAEARVLDAGDLVLERRDLGVELGEAVGGLILVAADRAR